jgi:hypothetical protein
MFFELIGTLVAGIAMALFVWALNRLLKGRFPSWLIPVSAGLAMLVATISSEYGWFERTKATMPDGMVVAQTVEEKVFYRPWTYANPFTSRFIAVDRASTRTHPDHPDKRIVDLVIYGRWSRTAKIPVLFDCALAKRADIVDGVEFSADGSVVGVQWIDMPQDDPVLQVACDEV